LGDGGALQRRWDPATGRRILVIFNPVAGRRPGRITAVTEALRRHRFAVELMATHQRGDAEAFAALATPDRCDLLIAAGGDGTINEVLNGMGRLDTPPPLAVFALGTANVLAAELALPCDPSGFARAIATTPSRPAWLGEVDGRRFSLMASVGFDAWAVHQLNPRLKFRFGRLAYGVSGVRLLLRSRGWRYRLRLDGDPVEAAGVIICKSRFYGGRFLAAPLAAVTDPSLHVCLLPRAGRLDIIRYAARLARGGGLQRAPGVTIRQACVVDLEGPEGEPVQVDGDILTQMPATVRLATTPVELVII
jgi:diacylglycerol kinase (ATP)